MYILKTEECFDSAHFLANYDGKCKNIHGHRWRVIVEIMGTDLDHAGQSEGMLVDFGQLKSDLKNICSKYDHALIIQENSLKDSLKNALLEEDFQIIELTGRPTAENLSKIIYTEMTVLHYKVKKVTVYETPNNCAEYGEGEDL